MTAQRVAVHQGTPERTIRKRAAKSTLAQCHLPPHLIRRVPCCPGDGQSNKDSMWV